jgi:hypothetical protein
MIDSIIASASTTSVSSQPRRREKIYCDKWIHEGVCAFTQMGCKYKHEMPMDKVTQVSLGLNHGVPNWYRRAYGVSLHPATPPVTAAPLPVPVHNSARLEGNWRRLEVSSSLNGDSGAAGSVSAHTGAGRILYSYLFHNLLTLHQLMVPLVQSVPPFLNPNHRIPW